jgi:hypothetical protein
MKRNSVPVVYYKQITTRGTSVGAVADRPEARTRCLSNTHMEYDNYSKNKSNNNNNNAYLRAT